MAKKIAKPAADYVQDARDNLLKAYIILKQGAVDQDKFDEAKKLKEDYNAAQVAVNKFAANL